MPRINVFSTTGVLLYTHRAEPNSLRRTLEAGVSVGTQFRGADLEGVHLQGAGLRGADLRGARLKGADLLGADLRDADLRGADLRGADLRGADLRGAHLLGAMLPDVLALARLQIVPDVGSFHGFKRLAGGRIAEVVIPAGVPRSNATGRTCRAACVEVVAIWNADGHPCESGVSRYNGATLYRVGERTTCDTWDAHRWNECSGGIHFYLTRVEAEHHD